MDVGSGLGDSAIYLTSKGYQVTALDLSQHALDRAAKRSKAAGLTPANPASKQADLLGLGSKFCYQQWDTALDSALLHCFPPDKLPRHVKKGGQLVLFTISDTNKDPWIGPERLSRAAFSWCQCASLS